MTPEQESAFLSSVEQNRRALEPWRPGCPDIVDLEGLARRALRVDPQSTPFESRELVYHLDLCDPCRADLLALIELTGRSPSSHVSPTDETRSPRAEYRRLIDSINAQCASLPDTILHSAGALLLDNLRDLLHVISTLPESNEVSLYGMDALLAREVSRLTSGDRYQTITRLGKFWKSMCNEESSMKDSRFYQAMVAALLKGVEIQRLFPLHVEVHAELIEALRRGRSLPNYRYIDEHAELAKRYERFRIRFVIVTGSDERQVVEPSGLQRSRYSQQVFDSPVVVKNFGICRFRNRPARVFVPVYEMGDNLRGLSFPPDLAERNEYMLDFETLWKHALRYDELCRLS
jgi:hypothetical protein